MCIDSYQRGLTGLCLSSAAFVGFDLVDSHTKQYYF